MGRDPAATLYLGMVSLLSEGQSRDLLPDLSVPNFLLPNTLQSENELRTGLLDN